MSKESENWLPHFTDTLKSFTELAWRGSWEAQNKLFGSDPKEVLAGTLLSFGLGLGPNIQEMREVYRRSVQQGMTADDRRRVSNYICRMVENSGAVQVDAYLPAIAADPERSIVAQSTLKYASQGPLFDDGDVLSRPKVIIELIRNRGIGNPGAAFGGLLSLGDPRLCRLLWPLKDELSYDQAREAARCFTDQMSAAAVEFILDWLEIELKSSDGLLFGGLVSNLLYQREYMEEPVVITGIQPFPTSSVSAEEHRAMLKLIPFQEYSRKVAPRLLALERAEPTPKLMSYVIHRWGVAKRDLPDLPGWS